MAPLPSLWAVDGERHEAQAAWAAELEGMLGDGSVTSSDMGGRV